MYPTTNQAKRYGWSASAKQIALDSFSQPCVPNISSAIVHIRYKYDMDCAYGNGFSVLAEDLDVDILRHRFSGGG